MTGIAAIFRFSGGPIDRAGMMRLAGSLRAIGSSPPETAMLGAAALCAVSWNEPDGGPGSRSDDPGGERIVSGGDGRFTLALDGRLDHRDDLAADLGSAPSDAARRSDAWLAMRAFETWGPECPLRMDGDFSLLVWDRAAETLYAIRDRMGMNSLVYGQFGGLLVVASSPRSVFAVSGAAREIDSGRLADLLIGIGQRAAGTLYKGIARVPSAHVLRATRAGVSLERYWSLDVRAPELRLARDDDYVAEGRALLERAVGSCMRTSARVACDLTGGLDSSAVAVTALGHLDGQKRLPVFTHVPESGWDGRVARDRYGDEAPYVRAIAAMHPRIVPHFVTSAGRGWDSGLADHFAAVEVLPAGPATLPVWNQIFAAARAEGAGVVLNGGGGNLTLSWEGRGAFAAWLRQRRLATLLRELKAIAPGPLPFSRAVVSRLLVPLGPDWLWRLYARIKTGTAAGGDLARYSFVRGDVLRQRIATRCDAEIDMQSRPRADYRSLRADLLTRDDNAEGAEIARAARMLHGVDYRSPLRDRRLVEWSLRVPEEQFWRDGQPRSLVRRVMAGRLPPEVLANRRRGAFGADWHLQMTRGLATMREQVEILADDRDLAPLLDFDRIRKAIADWPAEAPVEGRDASAYLLSVALPQAIAAARFVRWTKGANL